jgi:hypothetical protein
VEAIVEAGGTVGSDLNAVPELLASFSHHSCNATRSKSRGVDIDVQRVFVWRTAAVFNDAQVVWVDAVISEAISDLKLQMKHEITTPARTEEALCPQVARSTVRLFCLPSTVAVLAWQQDAKAGTNR